MSINIFSNYNIYAITTDEILANPISNISNHGELVKIFNIGIDHIYLQRDDGKEYSISDRNEYVLPLYSYKIEFIKSSEVNKNSKKKNVNSLLGS